MAISGDNRLIGLFSTSFKIISPFVHQSWRIARLSFERSRELEIWTLWPSVFELYAWEICWHGGLDFEVSISSQRVVLPMCHTFTKFEYGNGMFNWLKLIACLIFAKLGYLDLWPLNLRTAWLVGYTCHGKLCTLSNLNTLRLLVLGLDASVATN